MALQSAGALAPQATTPDEHHFTIIFIISGLVILSLPTLLVGLWILRYLTYNPSARAVRRVWIATGTGLLCTLLYTDALAAQYQLIYTQTGVVLSEILFQQRAPSLFHLALDYIALSPLTLPLAPFVGGSMDGFNKLKKRLRIYRTTEEMAEAWNDHEQQRAKRLEQRARQAAGQLPTRDQAKELFLGSVLGGDPLPNGEDSIGVRLHGNGLYLHEWALNEHLFMLGATGSGKSTALKRLCAEILANTSRDLFVIDGKGEDYFVEELRELVWTYRHIEPPVVRLGGLQRGDAYNAFCGTKEAVYNRIGAMAGIQEAEGNALIFANRNRNLLQLICFAHDEPPRSFGGLRERLSQDWLMAAYRGHHEEAHIASLKAGHFESLSDHLRPLIREFEEVISPTGFTLHDTHCAIFSIKTLSIGDSAKRFCRFLIEDVKDFVANRALRPGVVLFDEFGVFGSDNIRDVLAQARSKHWGIGLATQDYANLGDEQTARQILANTLTKVLLGTDFPEELAMQGGTKVQMESSIQSDALGPTGMTSGRLQHAIKVDINRARRFQRGQAYLIRKGHTVALQFSEVKLTPQERAQVPPPSTPSSPASAPEPPSTPPVVSQLPLPSEEIPPQPPRRRGRGKL